jgi:hypothetical protein
VKETHRVAQAVLDEHSVGIPRDEVLHRRLVLIGQQNGRFLKAQIQHEDLPEAVSDQLDPLLINPQSEILASNIGSTESNSFFANTVLCTVSKNISSGAVKVLNRVCYGTARVLGIGGSENG